MSDETTRLREAIVDRAVHGAGVSDPAGRLAAFENRGVDPRLGALVDTVARNAWKVTSGQVEAAVAAGLSEDEVFELVVCAALGQATRQRAAAAEALDAVFGAPGPETGGGTR